MKKVIWFTGLSGSGKTTIAERLYELLSADGRHVRIIDGDDVRNSRNRHLGFSREDIRENNRLIAEMAKKALEEHDIILVPIISPFREDRATARNHLGETFLELFVNTPLDVCIERDVKGLYAKAERGEITDMIGYHDSSPYESPVEPDIEVHTDADVDNIAREILDQLSQM